MTGKEWLMSKGFGVTEMPDGTDGFYQFNGDISSVSAFSSWFYPSIEQAEKSTFSTYDAAMSAPGGTRGWEVYFEDWKARSILS